MLLTARWLLDRNPDPDEGQIREAISGQLCRCTGYENIVRSIRWAAETRLNVAEPATSPNVAESATSPNVAESATEAKQ
jgi:carbon-monoxide dehydrogenase small subunit